MLKYVAIGAGVGFLVAYFLLSHASPADLTAPPRETPAAVAVPMRINGEALLNAQPLPSNKLEGRPPFGADAGRPDTPPR